MDDLIETHISRVFFRGDEVFKTKKPVRLSFLDYSTPALRKRACEAEVDLNSRLAPGIYLGVVPFRLPEGELDWAVRMRRMPEEQRADRLLANGKLGILEIDRLAAFVADFHSRCRCDEETSKYGAPSLIARNLRENFEQIPIRQVVLRKKQFSFLRKHRALFLERIRVGRIRDGHGDLRLEQIYLSPAGEITILDCIEFNDRFRYADVCADLAFLSMDLAYRGRRDLAERLLAIYAREANDFDLFPLVDFYQSYRATVRGKVELFRKSVSPARSYFSLARDYLREHRPAGPLIVFSGIIGSGKSTLADWLGARVGAPIAESDRIRKFLAGVPPTRPLRGPEFDGAYGKSFTNRVYREMLRRAEVVLRSGRPAIVDATFPTSRRRAQARRLAHRLRVPLRLVECRATPEVCLERLRRREGVPTVSDARAALLKEFLRVFRPATEWLPDERLVLDTTQPLSTTRKKLVAWILPIIKRGVFSMPANRIAVNSVIQETVSHPRTVRAEIRDDRVVLSGYILRREARNLVSKLRRVAGVADVENRLSELQVPSRRRSAFTRLGERVAYESENRADWPMPLRVSAGAIGVLTILIGLRKRLLVRVPLPFFGLGLLLRALTNFDLARITGTFLKPTIRLERTIRIAAPIDAVFDFVGRFENFSKFMSYVAEVKVDDRGGIHWKMAGPGKIPIEWDATVGLFVRNHALSWKSVPGSALKSEGQFILRAESGESTRVDISLSFQPPAGAFGFAIAHLIGFDPRNRIDEDLLFMRELIEDEFRQLESSAPLAKSSRL